MTKKKLGVVFKLFSLIPTVGCGLMMDDLSAGSDADASVSGIDTATGTHAGSDTDTDQVVDTDSNTTANMDSATQTDTQTTPPADTASDSASGTTDTASDSASGTTDTGDLDETDTDDTAFMESDSDTSLEEATDGRDASDDVDDTGTGCTGSSCPVCEPDDVQCSADGTPKKCNQEGQWEPQSPCAGETPYCQEGVCVTCEPGTRRCNEGLPQTCDTDGSVWRDEPACVGDTPVCYLGNCVACNPTSATPRCVNNTPEICVDGDWEPQTPCTGSTPVCQPSRGECGCSPGDCSSGQACVSDVCQECGGENQVCCEDGSCENNLSCQDSLCQSCGGLNEACCDDDQCDDALVCEIGVCESCGKTDEACCPVGTACITGYCDNTNTCVNGCFIDGASYSDRQVNPENDCELCDASRNAWQNQSNNTLCGGGNGSCNEGVCTSVTCEDYCDVISNHCTSASHAQYVANNICIAACGAFADGSAGDTTGNTIACRLYHAIEATTDPDTECPAAGPSGDGVCGGSCESYCMIMMTHCSDQFVDAADCQSTCATWADITFDSYYYRPFETTACALYGAQRAATDPEGYCVEASEARCP